MPSDGTLPEISTARRQEREDTARKVIAFLFVGGYLLVLLLTLLPSLIYLWRNPSLNISELKDVGTVMAAAGSSLSGLLGFVLGYYFKSSEQETGA